jgi:transcription initiation factor IIE alpha subunit
MQMDFVEAMERLKRAVTDDEIAAATGVSTNTIRRTRAEKSTRNYRPPPAGWERVLAALAEERAEELKHLKQILEAQTSQAS